jgi:hypothetical protein
MGACARFFGVGSEVRILSGSDGESTGKEDDSWFFMPALQRAGAMERLKKYPKDEARRKRALMEVGRMRYELLAPSPMEGGPIGFC